jgi:hypothetical protein
LLEVCQQLAELRNLILEAIHEREDANKQLAECQKEVDMAYEERAMAYRELAECQAREKVLRDAGEFVIRRHNDGYVSFCGMPAPKTQLKAALALPSDSTALDTLKKQWQRKVLLEARELLLRSCPFGSNPQAWYVNEIDQKVKELE